MSALTEKVAREHRPYRDPIAPGRLWLCECDDGDTSRDIVAHVHHIAAATEEAVRANVAAEIREQADTFMRVTLATYDDLAVKAYLDAYRIAEGKQP